MIFFIKKENVLSNILDSVFYLHLMFPNKIMTLTHFSPVLDFT